MEGLKGLGMLVRFWTVDYYLYCSAIPKRRQSYDPTKDLWAKDGAVC